MLLFKVYTVLSFQTTTLGYYTLTPFMVGIGGVCLIYILEVDLEGNLALSKTNIQKVLKINVCWNLMTISFCWVFWPYFF